MSPDIRNRMSVRSKLDQEAKFGRVDWFLPMGEQLGVEPSQLAEAATRLQPEIQCNLEGI